jgi:hypothetical protein
MQSRAVRSLRVPVSAIALAALLIISSSAEAKGKRETYVFMVTRVDLADGVKANDKLTPLVKLKLAAAIDSHKKISATLPKGAPDPKTEPAKFKRYIKRKRLRVFKVNVEVTEYSAELEEDAERKTRRYVVRLSLRMLGEVIPQRTMAFTGDGSATVKIDVGKKVRKADKRYTHEEAVTLAVGNGIAESLRKLALPPPSPTYKGKRKRKK